ncbi:MAG: CoA pyrophosphatase [Rhodocyclaceae bacterium]|nr:CoA pyrophosphatase [Rhodocyclaceae bacterium]MBX3669391.1 CoA pyrophosphatase [Rhodocyclaceae bacterium]
MSFDTIWLRQRFAVGGSGQALRNDPLLQELTAEPTPAAVLVGIVERPHGLTLLLTERTAHLHDHPGQVAFPGGRCEVDDGTPVRTALREAEEEIGLAPDFVDVIGCLPDYRTNTGFIVTPVVALVQPGFDLKLDDFEVAAVFEPPLGFLLDPANHLRHRVEIRGRPREFYAMPWAGHYIWGVTAGMIVSLHRYLYAKD